MRIRPYVSVFVVGKSGRRLEAPGLAVETGVPSLTSRRSNELSVERELPAGPAGGDVVAGVGVALQEMAGSVAF